MDMASIKNNSLLYRNQFVLGPVFIDELAFWKKIDAGSGIRLTVHPDLHTCQSLYKDKSLLLLGYILDPDNPDRGDSEILENLIRVFADCDSFYEQTHRLGGRWILIASDGRNTTLFNDATGLRQVFYTDLNSVKDLWCSSQPGMLAELLHLEMDDAAVKFIHSPEIMRNREYQFPGEASPYREIKHLLPNHCLDLNSGSCRRFWPSGPLGTLSRDEGIAKVSSILEGLMKSASSRFDLVLSMTAGLDSRVVLAASRPIRHKLSYLTLRQLGWAEDHADIAIPSMLLPKLGLKHTVLNSSHITDAEYIKYYKKNSVLAHDVWAPDAQAISFFYRQTKVAVTGSACEIARWALREYLPKCKWRNLSARDLSLLKRMGEQPFAIHFFDTWLSGVGEIFNLELLDLFEWEQGHGNWLAMCQLEFDSAWKDLFTPYNCRALLVDMLSVDEKHRKPPKYSFFIDMMMKLWPEVLSLPINPHKEKGLLAAVKRRMKTVRIARNRRLAFTNGSARAVNDSV